MENQIKETMRKKLASELSSAVKAAAKTGRWETPAPQVDEDCSPEDVAQMALGIAERALSEVQNGVPSWFTRSVSVTRTVMAEDELQGLECIAALYASTINAGEMQRMAALELLLGACRETTFPHALGLAL